MENFTPWNENWNLNEDRNGKEQGHLYYYCWQAKLSYALAHPEHLHNRAEVSL